MENHLIKLNFMDLVGLRTKKTLKKQLTQITHRGTVSALIKKVQIVIAAGGQIFHPR